jgi:hypothetical protein
LDDAWITAYAGITEKSRTLAAVLMAPCFFTWAGEARRKEEGAKRVNGGMRAVYKMYRLFYFAFFLGLRPA